MEIPLDKNAVERKAEQPQDDPQQQPEAQAESEKKGGALQDLGDKIREYKADVVAQVAGVGLAAITNLESFMAKEDYAASHPPTQQTQVSKPAPETTEDAELPDSVEPIEAPQGGQQNTPTEVSKQPEPRVVTNVYGIEVKPPPPPPPPPPANDNAPGLSK